jgi:general secretion pathway protein B
MSLILDALRKADAERERGSVPSLHSQPVVSHSAEKPPSASARPSWLWIAIGVALGLLAAALWVMMGRNAPAPSTATAHFAPASPSTRMVTPATPVAPVATSVAPSQPVFTDTQNVAEPAPWPKPDERKIQRAATKGEVQVPTLGNVPPAPAPIYSREQLPPDVRAALPQFAIGGSVYSKDPTARSLIVNGQLYRERDRLTQDLSLEEIKLKAAVFSFRGYRFEVVF